MNKPTIQIGHPSLKAPNEQIHDFESAKLKELIQDLTDTMHEAGLIGIAAPQIAENYQVFITQPRETASRPASESDTLRIYINPVITVSSSEESTIYEGCGSVMNGKLFGPVSRPKVVTIEAYNEHGKKFRFTADGMLGRVIQHEYDHLQGIEFTEKVTDYKLLMHLDYYLERIRTSKEQMEASVISIKEFQELS
ncbi:MAG: peptide deformylase [bacterium]|nr:peptide deformylase [bacterium]